MSTETLTPGDGLTIAPRDRKSMWRTAGAEVGALIVYVLGIELLLRIVDITPSGGAAVAVSLLLAGIPAVIWMAVFLLQDRAEPEPLRNVAVVGAAAGLLAVAVGQPLVTKAFGVNEWITRSTWTQIIGSVLVVGFVQEFCKYLAVRTTVYDGDAINQRVDGVVYGAAAGVGYATALNVSMVLAVGGFVDLRAGVVRIVATALTHGALGALVGYSVGRNRLERRPAWSVPVVLTAAAVVNGVSAWLRQRASERSISFSGTSGAQPARGLVVQCVIAVLLLAVVLVLVRRADQRVIPAAERAEGNRGPLLAAVAVTVVALLGGAVLRSSVLGETKQAVAGNVSVKVPATWNVAKNGSTVSARTNGLGGRATTLTVRTVKVAADLKDADAIAQVSNLMNVERGTEETAYKVFDLSAGKKVEGHPAATASYTFVTQTGTFLQESLPVVMIGEETYVRSGDQVTVLTLESPSANRSKAMPRYRAFVSSVRFDAKGAGK